VPAGSPRRPLTCTTCCCTAAFKLRESFGVNMMELLVALFLF
jgi:hypothetical protein